MFFCCGEFAVVARLMMFPASTDVVAPTVAKVVSESAIKRYFGAIVIVSICQKIEREVDRPRGHVR